MRVKNQLTCLVTDNVPDMIWAKDIDDRYTFANQANQNYCDKLLKWSTPEEAERKKNRVLRGG